MFSVISNNFSNENHIILDINCLFEQIIKLQLVCDVAQMRHNLLK